VSVPDVFFAEPMSGLQGDRVMLPPLNEDGYLPVGIHRCTFEELVQRFGHGSPERQVEIRELEQLVQWATRAGILRLIVNGSFVTAKLEPNDVDVIILPGPGYPEREKPAIEAVALWPFIHLTVAADDADVETWAVLDFGTDRDLRPKGVVEVLL
jgi:hypothetical protein